MQKMDILLVGFEEGENLGLRFISAYLADHGLKVLLQPYRISAKSDILRIIRETGPRIVGFSLIFQRLLYDFADLIDYLRRNGVEAHFTMGGHFPSIECRRTLEAIPGLDSVVRGEGEETLLELFRSIDKPGDFKHIKGLAYRRDGDIHLTEPRPLITDLDRLPFPLRGPKTMTHRGIGVATILGSRGCYYNCSFCSIRKFYSDSPGPLRRSRSSKNLVSEMRELFHERDIRIFIFEDDDFLTRNPRQRKWVNEFVQELKMSGIADQILWRISCRVDDVEGDLIRKMKEVGLMSVYIGIEAGNEQGLKIYNKHYTVADIYRTLDMLTELDMPFEFGFMILNPGSTLATVKEDIAFLKKINQYKQAVFQFTKMVPYSGTPIAERLEREGKLTGNAAAPEYSYDDPRVALVQLFFTQAFHHRNFENNGLVELLRQGKFDALVADKYFSDRYDTGAYMSALRELIYQCNVECLEKMSLGVNFMSRLSEEDILFNWNFIQRLIQEEKAAEHYLTQSLLWLMDRCGLSAQ